MHNQVVESAGRWAGPGYGGMRGEGLVVKLLRQRSTEHYAGFINRPSHEAILRYYDMTVGRRILASGVTGEGR